MTTSAHGIEIPTQLSATDRKDVVQILGISTSSKSISNPYPLGGYSGLELGLSLEFVDTQDLSRLGSKTEPDPEFRYPRLTIGKGLYNDLDFFVHFIPYNENSNVSEYGAMVRWSFFEAQFLPVNLSLLLHGNQLNVSDSFTNQTLGAELMCGINTNNFALYFGGGQLKARGEFQSGGSNSIIDPSDPALSLKTKTIRETVRQSHSFVGFSLHFADYFLAAQIDRYEDVVYAVNLGLRL